MNCEVIKRLWKLIVNWYGEYLEKASHMVDNYWMYLSPGP